MTHERRTRKLYESLSTVERARMVRDAYKHDRELDVLLDWTTPDDQRWGLSRMVRRMMSLNTNVAWLLTSWEARMRLLETQWCWFLTLRQWATTAREASAYFLLQEFDGSDGGSDAQRVRARLQAQLASAPLGFATGNPHAPLNDSDERAAALLAAVRDGLARSWQEFHAAEQVVSLWTRSSARAWTSCTNRWKVSRRTWWASPRTWRSPQQRWWPKHASCSSKNRAEGRYNVPV